jgi:hypothetical protein
MDATPIERKPTPHEVVSAENRSAALLAAARRDPTLGATRPQDPTDGRDPADPDQLVSRVSPRPRGAAQDRCGPDRH